MHFNAKRGIAIAYRLSVRLSVCLSVTLVNCDHICWNSSKIISALIIAWDVRSLQPQHDGSAPRGTPLNFGPKWPTPCWFERRIHSIANCGRIVTDSATVIALSNGAIADPLRPPLSPKWGFHMPPTYANGHISATGDPIHFMFCSRVGFSGTVDLMALFSIRTNSMAAAVILDNSEWPYLRNGYFYSAHCAVIFAIAQLSC